MDLILEHNLELIFNILIVIVEASGAMVIFVGVGRALWHYGKDLLSKYQPLDVTSLRIQLGQSMVLALEFQVAADILKTGVSPTWEDLLRLGAIIALRTVLNYLLERELEMLEMVCPVPQAEPKTFRP